MKRNTSIVIVVVTKHLNITAVAYLRGHAAMPPPPPPTERPKQIHCLKLVFKPMYFAQKCLQNAGNAVSETQISKTFRGGMLPDPLELCRDKIVASPSLKSWLRHCIKG